MVRYVATKWLSVAIPSSRRDLAGGMTGFDSESVEIGEEVPPDVVILASQQFVDEDGALIDIRDAAGSLIDPANNDEAAETFGDIYQTQFDRWLSDGWIVREEE